MPRITPGNSAKPVRRKQLILLTGIGVFITAIVLIAAVFTQDSIAPPAPPPQSVVEKSLGMPAQTIPDTEKWRMGEAMRIDALQSQMQQMSDEIERYRSAATVEAAPPPPPEPPAPTPEAISPHPIPGPASADFPVQPPVVPIGAAIGPRPRTIASVPLLEENLSTPAESKDEAAKKRTAENFLPSGTFIRAVNLTGLDAPTGGQAQNDPPPIVFRLVNHAILPNKFRADVKECFVVGNGFGDLSSERANIRINRLSCIDEKGGAIDVPITGFVSGEDGKAGMRGRLVEKQGQVLANGILAAVGSGIGRAFTAGASTTSTSALGNVTSIDKGKEFQAGIGAGLSDTMERLARYYISLAEKLFPVIEIDAGRTVDIVLTVGLTIERQ